MTSPVIELERLHELIAINRIITSSLDYDEVLQQVVEKTAAFTGAEACLLLLADPEGQARVAASIGIDPTQGQRFGAPLDEQIGTALGDFLGFQDGHTFIGVPVMNPQGLQGVLAIYRRGTQAVNSEEEFLLSALADQAAIALQHARQHQTLRRDLKGHEALTERLFHYAPLGFVILDADLVIRELNVTAAQLLGQSPEQSVGWSLTDTFGGAGAAILPLCQRALAGVAHPSMEIHYEVPGRSVKEEVFLKVRCAGLPNEAGQIEAVLMILTDITERKAIEDKLREQTEQLSKADRRKDEFLAMLAHELRNPLAPIQNAVHLLQRTSPNTTQLTWCHDVIGRQTEQLARLVDDLLDVSRITLGKIELQKSPLNLADIVQRAVETSRPLIDARRHEFSVQLPSEPVYVEGDLIRLAQVISNLLNNAAKYTDEGGEIRLSVERQAGDLLIRIRDTGRGINPKALPHLFDLFYQVDQTLDRTEGGLGIGLSLVQSLVALHGGHVEAFSAGRGQGSEFVVCLPRLPEAAFINIPDSGASVPNRGGLRILVVDDNQDAAESLAMLLDSDGHAVRVAYDGPTAVDVARAERPQIVLLDIGLPEMDGYAVARALRQCPELRRTRLVALTGYGQPEDRERSNAAGFDRHLIKPVNFEVLQALIAEFRAMDELAR